MPGRISHDPEKIHPDRALRERLNPQPNAGRNYGLQGPHPEKDNVLTAYDLKELQRKLRHLPDADLRAIPILPVGSKLEEKATYIDLREPQPFVPFTARAGMQVGDTNWFVPKSAVYYELWNRLVGVQH